MQNVTPRMVGDVDADGKADVVGIAYDGVYVSLSTGSSFTARQLWSTYWGPYWQGWPDQELLPRMLGDPNGDGQADLVGFANSGGYSSPAEPTAE